MAECISSSGKTSGTVVWVQRGTGPQKGHGEWEVEQWAGQTDKQGHRSRVAGLDGSHHPQEQQEKKKLFPEGDVWEGKQSKQTEGIVHHLNDKETSCVCEASRSPRSSQPLGVELWDKCVIFFKKVIKKQKTKLKEHGYHEVTKIIFYTFNNVSFVL